MRHISYDPAGRPEVSSLVLLAALCLDRDPAAVAGEIGDGGAAALKRTVTEAVNERFAPIRARRAALAADPGYARAGAPRRLRAGTGDRRRHPGGGAHGDGDAVLARTEGNRNWPRTRLNLAGDRCVVPGDG